MFGCCRALPPMRAAQSNGSVKETAEGRLDALVSAGMHSHKDHFRQAAKAIREARATAPKELPDVDAPALETLIQALFSDEASLAPGTGDIRRTASRGSTHQGSSHANQTADSRLYALALILCLTPSDDNKQIILSNEWLTEPLAKILREEQGSEHGLFVHMILHELASLRSTKIRMVQEEWIVDYLEKALEDDPSNVEIRPMALATIAAFATQDENRVSLGHRPRLITLVANIISSNEEPIGSANLIEALNILERIAEAKENRIDMYKMITVMNAVKRCIETGPIGSNVRSRAFGLLQNLAGARENKGDMAKLNWLMTATKRIIREEAIGSEVKAKAFGMLWSLAMNRRNQEELFQSRGLVDLVERSLSKEGEGSPVKANACGFVWGLCYHDQNKVDIFKSTRLPKLLVDYCILGERPGSEVRANALGALSELALADENKPMIMDDKKCAVMMAVKKVLDEEPHGAGKSEARAYAFALLWNLALTRDYQVALFRTNWVMDHAEAVLRDDRLDSDAKANVFAMLWNLAVANENKIPMFERHWVLKHALHSIESYRAGRHDEVCANALGLLQNLAGIHQTQVDILAKAPTLQSACQRILDRLLLLSAMSTTPAASTATTHQPIATPGTASGRMTPATQVGFGGSILTQPQVEVVVNCLGLLQNLAFAEGNKPVMMQWTWLTMALQRAVQDGPVGSDIKANAFGVLWNLAADRNNQATMLSVPSWSWLFPAVERVLREELIGSGVKTYALGMVREFTSGSGETLRQMNRINWLAETAERTLRDEPVGSDTKISALGMLQDMTIQEDCPRMKVLLSLTEQLIKEETNTSLVKLEATQWLVNLAQRNNESALRLIESYPSVLYSALRCFLEDDVVPAPLASTIDKLMFWLAKHPSSRQKALASAPNMLTTIQTRLRNTQCHSAILLQAYGIFGSEPTAKLPPLSSKAKVTRSIEILTQTLATPAEFNKSDVLEMLTGLTKESSFCRNAKGQILRLLVQVEPLLDADDSVNQERLRLIRERLSAAEDLPTDENGRSSPQDNHFSDPSTHSAMEGRRGLGNPGTTSTDPNANADQNGALDGQQGGDTTVARSVSNGTGRQSEIHPTAELDAISNRDENKAAGKPTSATDKVVTDNVAATATF